MRIQILIIGFQGLMKQEQISYSSGKTSFTSSQKQEFLRSFKNDHTKLIVVVLYTAGHSTDIHLHCKYQQTTYPCSNVVHVSQYVLSGYIYSSSKQLPFISIACEAHKKEKKKQHDYQQLAHDAIRDWCTSSPVPRAITRLINNK